MSYMLKLGEDGLNMAIGNYNVTSAWKRFTTKVDIDDRVMRPEIANSWRHCYQLGVDPYGSVNSIYLEQSELIKILDEKRNLINITRKVITDFSFFIAESGFIVMLSDERGNIMEVMGDSKTMAYASKYNLIKGASWAEEKAGTNGIGTSLAIKKPIQVTGAEHYCKKNHFWSCSAAPIFDNNGNIIGALQISGPTYKNHLHTLGLTVAAVESINNHMKLQESNRELIQLNSRLHNVLTTASDGIIITDSQGEVVQVNPSAESLLFKKEKQMRGNSVLDFMKKETVIKDMLSTGKPYRERNLILNTMNDNTIHCLSSGMPIKDDFDNIIGGVILLNPLNKTNKNVSRSNGASATFQFADIIGENEAFKKTIEMGKIAAGSISNVLLQGESGTGKEVFAKAIHNQSPRKDRPFIAVNCGAIPKELIGSELFGYEGGAFTGAKQGGKAGKFELAAGGTLFLDEIGDMPLDQQVALLRVLQDKQITRIGGEKSIEVDVRIICATNKNLRMEAIKGNFREDLFYRLNVISIKLPPLRERKDDIPLLLDLFVKKFSKQLGIALPYIEPKAVSYLRQYDWPGNVRELQNIVERILNLANGQSIGPGHLPEEILSPHQADMTFTDLSFTSFETRKNEKQKIRELLDINERQEIISKLLAANGNLSQTARDMGISRNTLYKKIKRLNIATNM